MIEWVTLSAGPRPVPRPVATPLVWAGAFAGAPLLVALTNLLAGSHGPPLALTALSVLAAVLGVCARFTAAPGTALLCWLFLNGFAIPPAGALSWTGPRDTAWLGCLLGAALAGTTVSRLAHARAAHHRLTTPGRDPDDGRLR
ncbi:hypothetical protein ABZ606_15480 [Streptomyces sp. NPDC012461]|uniref:Uncharacterized protein n=2 Tax=unclassified Streptomyces TaxID=2593676 RepID=A0A6G3QS06_9ACTN|nr:MULTISPECIES: hypothetical protein [unclassified Streptomyces]NEA86161.1 hypothetical protein [Streptomyces sp. SID14436]NEC80870.1 hypothetical protein [Streptomyces sp. SID7958]